MKFANQVLRWISRAGIGFATLAVGLIAAAYVVEVVARYLFNSPLNWSGDLGSYLLCAVGFLAMPQITRNRAHVAVTIVVENLPEKLSKAVIRGTELVTAAVLVIVVLFVLDLCVIQYQQGVLTPMANQIPRWWLTALIAFGLAISALNFIAPHDELSTVPAEM